METKNMNAKKGVRALSLLLVIALVGAMFVPAVSAENNESKMEQHLLIDGMTNINVLNAQKTEDLIASGIQSPEELTIPQIITKYDMITFDIPDIKNELENFESLDITIGNQKYSMKLTKADFSKVKDNIESYYGTLNGIENSEIFLTISDTVIVGSISIDSETFYVKPVEPRKRVSSEKPVLHIIYSSNSVNQEKPIKIDDGTLETPIIKDTKELISSNDGLSQESRSVDSTKQWTTVNILITTDNQFYLDESDWKATAEDIINTANSQSSFGRDDVQVSLCVVAYDDSKRMDLSNDPDITSEPLGTFYEHFDNNYLNARYADIALYLGGYNADGGSQGLAWGFGNGPYWGQWAWAQMVYDDPFYTGTVHGRRCISIHELGHIFNADHENSAGTNRAYGWWDPLPKHTVMWSDFIEAYNVYEYSSIDYHGEATRNNALAIRNAKSTVATYRNS